MFGYVKTGLVPMRYLVSDGAFKAGSVAGVFKDKATQYAAEGIATQEGIEPIKGAAIFLVADPVTVKKADAPEAPAPRAGGKSTPKVEIPAGWRDWHFLQQIKLAKELDPNYTVPEGRKSSEYAPEVIEAEEARRATA